MNINEFVEKYSAIPTDSLKIKFVKDNVKFEKYISYITKIDEAIKIVNSTCYSIKIKTDENGEPIATSGGRIKINTPLKYALTMHTIIKLYTNLETNTNQFIEEFDLLNKYRLVDILISNIPEEELVEFNTTVSMVYNDFVKNNLNVYTFLDNQTDKIKKIIETLESSENIMNIVSSLAFSEDNFETGTIAEDAKEYINNYL